MTLIGPAPPCGGPPRPPPPPCLGWLLWRLWRWRLLVCSHPRQRQRTTWQSPASSSRFFSSLLLTSEKRPEGRPRVHGASELEPDEQLDLARRRDRRDRAEPGRIDDVAGRILARFVGVGSVRLRTCNVLFTVVKFTEFSALNASTASSRRFPPTGIMRLMESRARSAAPASGSWSQTRGRYC